MIGIAPHTENDLTRQMPDASHPPARAAPIAPVKSRHVLRAPDSQGKVIAQFPISVGGRRETHGCIRLTNWDALKVAALVARGTPVDVEP